MGEAPRPIGELRPDARRALDDLVMRCLAKDAKDRPQSASDVIATLERRHERQRHAGDAAGAHERPGGIPTRAASLYVVSVVAVAAIAKAATVTIGLPDWVFPGALIVMALGLPVILFTGYVQSVARRAITATPTLTPGGGQVPQGTMATIALKASPHVSWRRTTRGGIYAVGAFVALIIAFMVMRAFGIGPVGSLFAAGKLSQRDVVLVSRLRREPRRFERRQRRRRGRAREPGRVTVDQAVQSGERRRRAERMQLPPTSKLDLALARQIAQREGVKAIVTGDVTGLGSGFVIALRLVARRFGHGARRVPDDGRRTEPARDAASTTSRGSCAARSASRSRACRRARRSTRSRRRRSTRCEAYTEGARAFDVEHDFTKAIPLLRRAVTIDTGFATAWRKLGTAMNNSFYPSSAVDSAVTKAYQLRARLSENERYLTEGYYFQRGPGHDRQRAIAAYQALIDRGDTGYAANNLAVALDDHARMRESRIALSHVAARQP